MKTKMISSCLLLTLLLLGLLHSAVAESLAAKDKDDIIAVFPKNFPPYYMVDDTGRPMGYAIDTMNHLAELAGLTVHYLVKPDWESTMASLRSGEADLIPNLGITAERSEYFAFTTPIETFAIGLFVRETNTEIHDLDGLAGKEVAVVRLNVAVKWLKKHPQIKPQLYDYKEQALFALLAGKAEAFIYPATVTWKMANAIGVDNRIRQAGLPLLEIKRAIAVRREDEDIALFKRLNQAVMQYTSSKIFQETYTRWHAGTKPFWTLERMLQFGGGTLVGLLLMSLITMLWWRRNSIQILKQHLENCVAARANAESQILELKAQLALEDQGSGVGDFSKDDDKAESRPG